MLQKFTYELVFVTDCKQKNELLAIFIFLDFKLNS